MRTCNRAARSRCRLRPDHIGIVNTHSVALLYLRRPDEALAAAKMALSLDAKNSAAHFNLGNALYSLGDYEEAEASFRQAIALAPDVEAAHKNLAGTLLALEQFDNALNSFDRAVELSPQSEDTQTNRSLVYLGLGDFKRGWTEYQHRFNTDRVKCGGTIRCRSGMARHSMAHWWSGASRGSVTRSFMPA